MGSEYAISTDAMTTSTIIYILRCFYCEHDYEHINMDFRLFFLINLTRAAVGDWICGTGPSNRLRAVGVPYPTLRCGKSRTLMIQRIVRYT